MPDPVEEFTFAEVALAARSHGMLLETLRDPVTPPGLHYLLNHFDVPPVDQAGYRLVVDGCVERQLTLSLPEIRSRPVVERTVTLECAGNGRAFVSPRPRTQPWVDTAVGTAVWRGTPLRDLLGEAGLEPEAREIVFVGLDHGIESGIEQDYARSLTVAEAGSADALLAYEMNGAPLPPQHGFPLRLVVPGWYGMASVKWLSRITAIDGSFDGYYQTQAYCLRDAPDDPGVPITRMLPRALMSPPGLPEFPGRRRYLPAGACRLQGRAWSGFGRIEGVDVSADGGARWDAATVEPAAGGCAWQRWSFDWTPPAPGDYQLVCRARDDSGRSQPLEPVWNLGGYVNNAVQRVNVTVR